jgi:hypothetical protein
MSDKLDIRNNQLTKGDVMAKTRMRDIVILLPGILGSVLKKGEREIWSPWTKMVPGTILSLGSSLQQLKLDCNDSDADEPRNRVQATELMPGAHLLPGLGKFDVYSKISDLVTDYFDVTPGTVGSTEPANFFKFPYDWRLDNRYTAQLLKKLIDNHLYQWRKEKCKDAKVILLAHSMGGLIARYYLEVLEGWRDCRALITFGTPYRGSVNALNFLVNGYKKLPFLDLTEPVRSFPSVYQLLPIYKMVNVGDNQYQRVAEIENILGIKQESIEEVEKGKQFHQNTKKGLEFHREIEESVKKHKEEAEYSDPDQGYRIIPVVGIYQDTYQSAELKDGKLTASNKLPLWIDASYYKDKHENGDGDGTVPRLSATPIEFSHGSYERFSAEQHSFLQCNSSLLEQIRNLLMHLQISGEPIRAPVENHTTLEERTAINLELDDLYLPGEPVEIHAKLVNLHNDPGVLRARIKPIDRDGEPINLEFQNQQEHQWGLVVNDLLPGLYRLEVRTLKAGPQAPTPVHSLFAVGG